MRRSRGQIRRDRIAITQSIVLASIPFGILGGMAWSCFFPHGKVADVMVAFLMAIAL